MNWVCLHQIKNIITNILKIEENIKCQISNNLNNHRNTWNYKSWL